MDAPEAKAGSLIDDRYLLLRRVGQGGGGAVWEAQDRAEGGAPVALKLFRPQLARSEAALRRRSTEVRVQMALDHPNIARAYAYRLTPEPAYLVMELIQGTALDLLLGDRTRSGRPWPTDQVAEVVAGIAAGLTHAHQRGVLHRDLKPQNVLLDRQGQVKLVDFGVSKTLEEDDGQGTTRGRRVGSFMYMSPEQARGEPPDARTDVYALGTLAFELLTSRRAWALTADGTPCPAYDGPTPDPKINAPTVVLERASAGPRPRPSALRPELGAAVDEVIARATAPDREDRYATAVALAEALAEALGVAEHDTRLGPAPDPTVPAAGRPAAAQDWTPREHAAEPPPWSRRRRAGRTGLRLPLLLGFLALGFALAAGLVISLRQAEPLATRDLPPATPRAATATAARAVAAPLLEEPEPPPLVAPPARSEPARRPTRRRGAEPGARVAEPEPFPELIALRRGLESDPSNAARLEALAEGMVRAADGLADRAAAKRIQAMARTSALAGDAAGLGEALDELLARGAER